MSMVALDLETTGLDVRQDKIIEIGMIRFDGAQVLETYQTFINPDRPIPPAVTQLTHITNPMVTKAPHILDVLDEVSDFAGNDAIVGHNIGFDLGFLHRYKILMKNRSTDTYELASVLLPRAGRYKLSALAEQFNIDAGYSSITGGYAGIQILVGIYDDDNNLIEKFKMWLDKESNNRNQVVRTRNAGTMANPVGQKGKVKKIFKTLLSGSGYVRIVAERFQTTDFDMKIIPYSKPTEPGQK